MKVSFNRHHPIVDIQGNLVFANNGNIILCYKMTLPEIYSLSESDYEELHASWFQGLKSLPVGSVVHKQDIYQRLPYSSPRQEAPSFLAKATADYFEGREYTSHSSYLFLIWPKNKGFNTRGLINPFKNISKTLPLELNQSANAFIKAASDTIDFLSNRNCLNFRPLQAYEIQSLARDFFNGYHTDMNTDVLLEKDNIQIGDHLFNVLSINHETCFGQGRTKQQSQWRFYLSRF